MTDKPLSIAEAAVALHESFLSLLRAGFDEKQALYLVAQMVRPQQGPPS
ncbi:hypothetical protein [Glutamicibacter sp. V16R2B1]|nr:hypothetical protein [Glutamicibacter sp. V16R2B1]MCK9901248.1 hypothetical protein [Frankia sp. Cpl3]